ncbi:MULTISPECIES: ABC transporter substrate-binding protein [Achromobacter]|jgi:polar amino acid transport system substrate-binding protein|uniref:ABC transporter substrate-binding protein n=1 Tax=Achromobacter aegrifaciens TaxID=1287736 RepID=A0AAD2IWH6_ACHAE|nr:MULTISPECIES: ABC transporter substrate-binding protein [Achromobacter]PTN52143.1 amino acid ABC transporter substrate-binding protein [Achromobacter xylosoxidans]MBD9419916.1 amino acid ABC transporter substrate-binding protein [Achromobacter sp. ACM04]MBD9431216.1 amino acid ABC transporter substrate-binding protein [Achromobacter sp. ACM03]MBD9472773.1 amino acid ABC transporter substrate-binding protein [Achromobacter sp. ACM01]MDQ1762330.1 ABC transporter substrate-binding protein [Ach
MKLKSILLGLAVAGLLAQGGAQARTLDEIRADQSLNVVTTASAPPHGFKNPKSNQLEGIMVDVAAAVAKHLKVSDKLSDVPFSGLIPTLTSGRADVMSAPLFITEERARAIDFSAPVYEWGEGIVVSDKADKKYAKFEDMKGQRVGVLVDSVQFNMIKDMPGTKVSTYQDYSTLLADVRAGRIDLGIVDPPSIIYQIKTKNIPGVKLDTGYQPQRKWQVGMAVQKGNAALLEAVNGALAQMKQNGELAAIGQKWGVADLMSK